MAANQNNHLWLRAEVKPFEHRTPVTPDICKKLIDQGFKITVEKSADRCVPDQEYAAVGCEMVEPGTWRGAPLDAFIFGVKELPENDDSPLTHRHIFFGHCFKGQTGWRELLARFRAGGGSLLDLEFLTDDKGRRVAAFGYMAGYAGSAMGIDVWCQQQIAPSVPYGSVSPYPNDENLKAHIRTRLAEAKTKAGRLPRVLVIGALGRCGNGACDLAVQVGLPEENVVRWDMADTSKGGPFPELMDVDIVVNCIYLSQRIPSFLTIDMLQAKADRALSVIVDVSCDYTSANNPLPVYDRATTFEAPTLSIPELPGNPVEVISIDHLPTLLPLESSQRFGADLLPTLLALPELESHRVWADALALFKQKMAEAQQ